MFMIYKIGVCEGVNDAHFVCYPPGFCDKYNFRAHYLWLPLFVCANVSNVVHMHMSVFFICCAFL